MKKKILVSALEIRNAVFPVSTEFKAVKLTYAQAMNFQSKFTSFEELLAEYGVNNQLKVGEFYDGYLAVCGYRFEVVKMYGCIQRIPAHEACGILNYRLAEEIRTGKAWQCVYIAGERTCQGAFQYVWNFRDCTFGGHINQIKNYMAKNPQAYTEEEKNIYASLDAEKADEQLKNKLVSALLTESKIIELSEAENMVLKHYLGEYYRRFFAEVA